MKRRAGLFFFLLNYGLLSAQNQQTENLQRQFQNYQSNNLQEKLFVHIDKSFYLAGETVWFKIYSVDASFHKPLTTSSITYVEILNKDLKPVMQTKIPMLNGSGNGSLSLPGFLVSGNYIFRAYTSWMKNFSPDFYYESTLHIINTLKQSVSAPSLKSFASIQFFPEGGNAVIGFKGKIAFKAIGKDGRDLECGGVIVNQNNDTITKFQSLHNGMGYFLLRPEKNSAYFAVLRLDDSLIKQQLPKAEENGFVMSVMLEEAGKFKITVGATPEFNNTNIYLFAQTRQVIKNVQISLVKDGEASFFIDQKDLGDGISGITLFNHLRQPVCERLVFKRPKETLSILTKTDQAVYDTRKQVNIDVTTNSTNLPSAGNLSMSVFLIDSLQGVPEQNILSYLFLSSDLNGNIESPEYYFTNPDKTVDEALDNLLLTQGWRRFKWNEVFDYNKPSFEFLPEIEGPVINGKIINKSTGLAVGASGAFLSIPGADNSFSCATSDAQGVIRFAFKDIYKNNAIIVQPTLLKDSNYRIDISKSYSDKFSSYTLPSLIDFREKANILLNHSVSNQVENTYAMDKKRQYVKKIIDTNAFYGKPDRLYILDDYTRFQTMEEVLREFVEDVRLRKEGDKFTFKVRNRLFGTYFEEDPLILLDGIPISDASKIIALDPLKIWKIGVVTHDYYIGSSVFEGIVNIKSYSGELGVTQIDPNSLVVEYDGLQEQREFYSPAYATRAEQDSHMPDFRNVLYWAPQISTGRNGKTRLTFYTSDLKGKFAVVIQGISPEGLPGKTTAFFEVTDSK
ncbi:MAG TPA: hypothetical protein VNW49_10590 [Puia sp.]|nr:hypothetical protein [Puia sp.]